jgi:Zn-finger nucleic acid-binding protein
MSTEPARHAEGATANVERCRGCDGVWLDADVVMGVVPTVGGLRDRALEIQLVGQRGAHLAACPRCAAVPYEFALLRDLLVDYCPGCSGVWLDGGEYDPAIFDPVPERRAPREKNPYRAAAEKSERKREVLCHDCTKPVVVADSFATDRGLVCHRCWASRESHLATRRANDALEVQDSRLGSILGSLLNLVIALGTPPPRR